jgi:hypothetical protein
MIRKAEAIERALAAGATVEDIAAETRHQERHVGTVPFNNMIRALSLPVSNFLNSREDWTRLAAALTARGKIRGKTR